MLNLVTNVYGSLTNVETLEVLFVFELLAPRILAFAGGTGRLVINFSFLLFVA